MLAPEIDQFDRRGVLAVGQHEVLRLQVAVDDASRVQVAQRIARRAEERRGLGCGSPALSQGRGERGITPAASGLHTTAGLQLGRNSVNTACY